MAPLHPAMSAADLIERWTYRDQRYRRRRLSDSEITSIRLARQGELEFVRAHERAIAYGSLMRWMPPVGRRAS